jgi:hypothetical protein
MEKLRRVLKMKIMKKREAKRRRMERRRVPHLLNQTHPLLKRKIRLLTKSPIKSVKKSKILK